MIQRIQTVFLLLASLALGIEAISPVLSTSSFQPQGIYRDGKLFIQEDTISLVLLLLAALVAFLAIFIFKNLKFQKNLILVGVLFLVASLIAAVMAFLHPTQTILSESSSVIPQAGAFMPWLALIFFLFAYRNVGKDQKIIKSMDRLR